MKEWSESTLPVVVTEYDLHKIIRDIDACTKYKFLKVKAPVNFLGKVG
jgi:hypothetical protein